MIIFIQNIPDIPSELTSKIQQDTMSFTTIKNGVDERLTIIRHDESGFYNITKTARLIHKLKNANSESAPSDSAISKQIEDWLSNIDTTRLFDGLATFLNQSVDSLKFEITSGSYEHRGTYVHPKIYDLFVAWLDPDYTWRISDILEKILVNANRVLQDEEARRHEEARRRHDEEARHRREEHRRQIDELLEYAKKTSDDIGSIKNKVVDIKNNAAVIKGMVNGNAK